MTPLISEFKNCGLIVHNPILDGSIKRCGTESNPKGKNGYYIGWTKFLGGKELVCCSIGDWAQSDKPLITFKSWKDDSDFSQSDRDAIAKLQAELQQKAAAEKIKRHQEAAKKAQSEWLKLSATGESQYLESKDVQAYGIRFGKSPKDGNFIAVLLRDYQGNVKSLQFIYDTKPEWLSSNKYFLGGGEKQGCFHLIGGFSPDLPVCFAEGYATAATIHEATGYPVVVCFDAGNIEPVVKVLRENNPTQNFIVCADNDQWGERNAGIEKAIAAAKKYDCYFVFPDFAGLSVESKPTDFNDLAQLAGLERVKNSIIQQPEIMEALQNTHPAFIELPPYQPAQSSDDKKIASIAMETGVSDDKPLAFDFPTFDFKNYYGIAGDVADIGSAKSEADPMAIYISFLTTAAALIGRHKYLQIGESRHYPRIFTALVGASSRARKGTSFKPVERIIRKAEEIYNTSCPADIKTLSIQGGLSSGEGLVYQVRDEADETKGKDDLPLWAGVDDKRLLIVEEEFANVLTMCRRDGNTLSATLRNAWDGKDLSPMTKNNRIKATNPHVNLLGHITQFELKCLMSQSDIHNGLGNRFLWACVRRSKKLAFPEPMPDAHVNCLAEDLAKAFRHCNTQGEMKLSNQAREYWNIRYHEVSKDQYGIIGSITSRSEAHVMRLSLLFALLDCEDWIEPKHIQAGEQLVNFCNESVKFTFSTPADFEAGTDAEKLLNELGNKPMTQTEISKLFNGNKKREELASLLNELQSMGKLKQTQMDNKSGKGRKMTVWTLI